MSIYRVNSHEVLAQRIVKVEPLFIGGDRILVPDAGIILRFGDDRKIKWLAEENTPMPQAGDFLVTDNAVKTTYVVSSEVFAALFQQAE